MKTRSSNAAGLSDRVLGHAAPRSKRLLPAREAAAYLGYESPWPIRSLMWKGELPYVRLSQRRIAFDLEDLDRFIEARKIRECVH